MKQKFIWICAGSLALASCTKVSMDEIVKTPANQIGFNAYTTVPTKGAAIAGNSDFTGGTMGIYASYNNQTFMNNIQLTNASTTNAPADDATNNKYGWGYANAADIAYWPSDVASKPITFFAYSPYATNGTHTFTPGTPNLVVTDYTVPTTVADQKDFMYAVTQATTNTNPVDLLLKHGLSQIKFSAKVLGNNMYALIKEDGIKLVNIIDKGTLTVANTGTGTWASGSSVANYTNKSAAAILTGEASSYTDLKAAISGSDSRDNVLMLLPQTLKTLTVAANQTTYTTFTTTGETGAYLAIDLKLVKAIGASPTAPTNQTPSGDGYIYYKGSSSEYATIYVPLSVEGLTAWEQGKIYNYQITIDPSKLLQPIQFRVKVDAWSDNGNTALTNVSN